MTTPILSKDQQAIEDAGLLAKPSVINLPTGGGKTWIARRAIKLSLDRGLKAVYLPPLRSIAKELSGVWREVFHGKKVGLYTGELGLDEVEENPSPAEADVLIATPEKFDLYLRTWGQHLHWLSKIDLVVVDELHTLGGDRRGATLEGMLTRLQLINPYARVMGLSATLGNPDQLAGWLGGEAYVSNTRPIPLTWRIRSHSKSVTKADVVVDEAHKTIEQGGQMIVFVQSRPRTESLVKHLAEGGVKAVAHHAGMSKAARDKSEMAYRDGSAPCLVSTPTLAMGVNLPARTVVLHDLQRWDGGMWADLSTNEIWQLAGRAGRPGLDKTGEVILIAPAWNQIAARRYIEGKFEPIRSQLEFDAAFGEQLMVAFGSRMALKKEQAERILAKSFFAQGLAPGWLTKRVDKSINEMVLAGMLECNEEHYIRATRLGRVATRFQLTPKTVMAWSRLEELLPEATLFDLLLAICASPDFTARMRVDHGDLPTLQTAVDAEPMQIRLMTETTRNKILGTSGKELVGSLRTALSLRAWTRLGEIEDAASMFGCLDHEVEEARKEAVRLLQAFAAMVSAKPRQVAGQGMPQDVGLVEKASALTAMVCAGLDDEQATLALISGIGPVMARRLAGAGFSDIEALAQADPNDVAQIDGISLKRATKWISEADDFIGKGGALRYREVCNQQVSTGGRIKLMPGLDYYRWIRAMSLKVEAVGPSWNVTGGSEQHLVTKEAQAKYRCDCMDAKRGRLCKHRIAVMHVEGVVEVPRFDAGFPKGDGAFDLEGLWTQMDTRGLKCR
jgi:helicase